MAGLLAALALPALADCLHLAVVGPVDRFRYRRWTVEWEMVEPTWAGRCS